MYHFMEQQAATRVARVPYQPKPTSQELNQSGLSGASVPGVFSKPTSTEDVTHNMLGHQPKFLEGVSLPNSVARVMGAQQMGRVGVQRWTDTKQLDQIFRRMLTPTEREVPQGDQLMQKIRQELGRRQLVPDHGLVQNKAAREEPLKEQPKTLRRDSLPKQVPVGTTSNAGFITHHNTNLQSEQSIAEPHSLRLKLSNLDGPAHPSDLNCIRQIQKTPPSLPQISSVSNRKQSHRVSTSLVQVPNDQIFTAHHQSENSRVAQIKSELSLLNNSATKPWTVHLRPLKNSPKNHATTLRKNFSDEKGKCRPSTCQTQQVSKRAVLNRLEIGKKTPVLLQTGGKGSSETKMLKKKLRIKNKPSGRNTASFNANTTTSNNTGRKNEVMMNGRKSPAAKPTTSKTAIASRGSKTGLKTPKKSSRATQQSNRIAKPTATQVPPFEESSQLSVLGQQNKGSLSIQNNNARLPSLPKLKANKKILRTTVRTMAQKLKKTDLRLKPPNMHPNGVTAVKCTRIENKNKKVNAAVITRSTPQNSRYKHEYGVNSRGTQSLPPFASTHNSAGRINPQISNSSKNKIPTTYKTISNGRNMDTKASLLSGKGMNTGVAATVALQKSHRVLKHKIINANRPRKLAKRTVHRVLCKLPGAVKKPRFDVQSSSPLHEAPKTTWNNHRPPYQYKPSHSGVELKLQKVIISDPFASNNKRPKTRCKKQ